MSAGAVFTETKANLYHKYVQPLRQTFTVSLMGLRSITDLIFLIDMIENMLDSSSYLKMQCVCVCVISVPIYCIQNLKWYF